MSDQKSEMKSRSFGCVGIMAILLIAGFVAFAVILFQWSSTAALLSVVMALLMLRVLYYYIRWIQTGLEKYSIIGHVDRAEDAEEFSLACSECGYSLVGLPQSVARCPECGLLNVRHHDEIETLLRDALGARLVSADYSVTTERFDKGCITLLRLSIARSPAEYVLLEIQSEGTGIGGGCWVNKRLRYQFDYDDAWREHRKQSGLTNQNEADPVLAIMVHRLVEKAIQLSGH